MAERPLQGLTEGQDAALSEKLDGAVVSTREQSGRKLSYVEGHYCIRKANEVFGFAGWRRQTEEMRLVTEAEYIGTTRDGKERKGWLVAYIAHVTASVRTEDGWVTTDAWGYGEGIEYKNVGQAHESAIKEAETDAMKRALIKFGDPFGLALYDKQQRNVEGNAAKAAPRQQPAQQPAGDGEFGPCPKCGKELRTRKRKDGGEFVGCSGYPDCDFTCNVDAAPAPATEYDGEVDAGRLEDDPFPGDDDEQHVIKTGRQFADAVVALGLDAGEAYEQACAERFEGTIPDKTDITPRQWQELYDDIVRKQAGEEQ